MITVTRILWSNMGNRFAAWTLGAMIESIENLSSRREWEGWRGAWRRGISLCRQSGGGTYVSGVRGKLGPNVGPLTLDPWNWTLAKWGEAGGTFVSLFYLMISMLYTASQYPFSLGLGWLPNFHKDLSIAKHGWKNKWPKQKCTMGRVQGWSDRGDWTKCRPRSCKFQFQNL